jgi:DNA polymerase delta subunit 1
LHWTLFYLSVFLNVSQLSAYFPHTDDVARIGADNCAITPTGAAFLQPSIRPGILPAILSALMSARATTRGALKGVQKELQQARQAQQQPAEGGSSKHAGESVVQLAARAAVLDGRQKALKVTANALYVSQTLAVWSYVTLVSCVMWCWLLPVLQRCWRSGYMACQVGSRTWQSLSIHL